MADLSSLLIWDYTLRNVVLGSAIIGAVGGALGTFAVLRRQSLLGDALAHAALPGVCLAFILTGAKGPLSLMIGAAISAWIGTLVLLTIVRNSRIKDDAALGIVLSVFFGVGILLLTRIQHSGEAAQSGLDRFLFGQAATLLARDVRSMAVLGAVTLALVWLLFKEFKLISFDPDFAASAGFPPVPVSILLTSLIVVAVVIGLQTVGVVLMVAMLIAPAAAARQWTNRLGTMIFLAGSFGATAGVAGAVLSSRIPRLPTGPTIVLVATAIVGVSLLLAPERGLLWGGIKRWRHRQSLRASRTLRDLADLAGGSDPAPGFVTEQALAMHRGESTRTVAATLRALARQGLVARTNGNKTVWAMTPPGSIEVERAARQERLWKAYLAQQMDLPVEAVHLSADDVERVLPPSVLASLEQNLVDDDLRRETTVHTTGGLPGQPPEVAGAGGDR